MKFIAQVEFYPNCPSCDGSVPSHLQFFKSLKEMLTWALDNLDIYEINHVYYVKSKDNSARNLTEYGDMKIKYLYGFHHVTGIQFKYKRLFSKQKGISLITTKDNDGKLKWVRE